MSLNNVKTVKLDSNRQKKLGQYFSGNKLSRLLLAISDKSDIANAIDPMCGSGDMLRAIKDEFPNAVLSGIEIDSQAYNLCLAQSNEDAKMRLVHGDAFDWNIIKSLPVLAFDLVMTNPPYVRYQTLSSLNKEALLPNSDEIREALLKTAQKLPHLETEARDIFVTLIKGYSGLADLAVPAWILCAMLTKVGGTLAMVVPESWLSREYAKPIHYMLLKLFKIRWIVEDTSRVWFQEGKAQVKTTLLVAERVPYIFNLEESCINQKYYHIMLPSTAIDEYSLVGNLYPNIETPEKSFLLALKKVSSNKNALPSLVHFDSVLLTDKLQDVIQRSYKFDWFQKCEPLLLKTYKKQFSTIDKFGGIPLIDFIFLTDLGVEVGQGLRTGANTFFYCDEVSYGKAYTTIKLSSVFKNKHIKVPTEILRPVLRKQNELNEGYRLDESMLSGRVIVLENYIHPKDVLELSKKEQLTFNIMPNALSLYIDEARVVDVGTEKKPKFIPSLSAVKTNSSSGDASRGAPPRYWYTLPSIKPRHKPDLFIPRINNGYPKMMLNSEKRVIVDANFSTLWLRTEALVDKYAILAFFNCNWSIACMESIASVMGGGALKLEASHLRQLTVPKFDNRVWKQFSTFGKELVDTPTPEQTIEKIDMLFLKELYGQKSVNSMQKSILKIQQIKLNGRK